MDVLNQYVMNFSYINDTAETDSKILKYVNKLKTIQKKLLFKLLNNTLTVNSSKNLIWLAHEKDQEVT